MLPPRREPQAEVAVRSHHDKSDQAMTNSINRRSALGTMAGGFGSLAFAAMATEPALAADSKNPLAPKPTHFPARAKHVRQAPNGTVDRCRRDLPVPVQNCIRDVDAWFHRSAPIELIQSSGSIDATAASESHTGIV